MIWGVCSLLRPRRRSHQLPGAPPARILGQGRRPGFSHSPDNPLAEAIGNRKAMQRTVGTRGPWQKLRLRQQLQADPVIWAACSPRQPGRGPLGLIALIP